MKGGIFAKGQEMIPAWGRHCWQTNRWPNWIVRFPFRLSFYRWRTASVLSARRIRPKVIWWKVQTNESTRLWHSQTFDVSPQGWSLLYALPRLIVEKVIASRILLYVPESSCKAMRFHTPPVCVNAHVLSLLTIIGRSFCPVVLPAAVPVVHGRAVQPSCWSISSIYLSLDPSICLRLGPCLAAAAGRLQRLAELTPVRCSRVTFQTARA